MSCSDLPADVLMLFTALICYKLVDLQLLSFLFTQEALTEVTPQGHVYYLLDPFSDGDQSRDPTPELPGSRQTNHTHKVRSEDLAQSTNGEHFHSIEDNLEATDKGHSAYK